MRVHVVVDVHEVRSSVPAELLQLGIDIEIASLEAGDYDAGAATLVERKTTFDLALSLQNGRLWRQLGALRRRSSFPVLMIEGTPVESNSALKARRGLTLAVLDQGIVVLSARDARESAAWIAALAQRRQHHVPRDRPPHTYRKKLPNPRPGEALLCAIPGISSHHARALLDAFGSVSGVVQASPEAWLSVQGIGARRAAAMAQSFGDHP